MSSTDSNPDSNAAKMPSLAEGASKMDFLVYQAKMQAYLTMKKCELALSGEAILPDESEVTTDAAKLHARNRNKTAYGALVMSAMSGKTLSIFSEAKTPEHPSGNAQLAWEALEKKYLPIDTLSETEMERELSQEDLAKYEAREGDAVEIEELASDEPDSAQNDNGQEQQQQQEQQEQQAPVPRTSGRTSRAPQRLLETCGAVLSDTEQSMYQALLATVSINEFEIPSETSCRTCALGYFSWLGCLA